MRIYSARTPTGEEATGPRHRHRPLQPFVAKTLVYLDRDYINYRERSQRGDTGGGATLSVAPPSTTREDRATLRSDPSARAGAGKWAGVFARRGLPPPAPVTTFSGPNAINLTWCIAPPRCRFSAPAPISAVGHISRSSGLDDIQFVRRSWGLRRLTPQVQLCRPFGTVG